MITDWEKLRTDPVANAIFNEKITHGFQDLSYGVDGAAYTAFNDHIIIAAQDTATRIKSENREWFHHL